jgi:isoleucyl-tRNA synthetase
MPPKSPEGGLPPKYQTARKSSYHLLKEKAEERKKHPTEAEKILWEALRGKKLSGYKFRREHIIDEYIADFVCLSRRLIVEVDGGYHSDPEIMENDEFRSKFLKENFGYEVIRFSNEEVIGGIDAVLEKIEQALKKTPLRGDRGAFKADFIAEGVDQTRGWFYTLHAIATIIFDDVAYKNVISNGLVLDKNGQKMSKRLGNAADPFETLGTFGADATRWYLISNANPWDNLKFDLEGIAEVRRKFFGTLYNTYSFFVLYANLDNFTYQEADIPLEERPEIDRWVLSELHTLIKKVDEFYADYEPTRATRAISEFVQENLSNWFVRLSRRRFWKGDYEQDKISAYQTLYTCLLTVAKLAAPAAPFFMDRLYRDLNATSNKEVFDSVHLADFPEYIETYLDKDLERKMEKAQIISSLVLSLRKKEMIKVRQPLQRIMIPVLDEQQRAEIEAVEDLIKSEVNVKEIELIDDASGLLIKQVKPNFKVLGPRFGKDMKAVTNVIEQLSPEDISTIEIEGKITVEVNGKMINLVAEEIVITSQDIEGWLVASSRNITVALDVNISEELKKEGIARELVNRIQNLRKDSGFEVTDTIDVFIQKDGVIEDAILENINYIKNETLIVNLELASAIAVGTDIEFDNVTTKLFIKKH